MLLEFEFSNFFSFYEETKVSFAVGKKPASTFYDIDLADGTRINKVIGILGANGSGKTQLLKSFAFLSWFITGSFLRKDNTAKIPFSPHVKHSDEPSKFSITFLMNDIQYKYQLVLDNEKVLHESLKQRTSHLYSYIFVRDLIGGRGGHYEYSYKQQGFEFSAAQAKKVRANASIISTAYSHDVPLAQELHTYFFWVSYNVNTKGRRHYNHSRMLDAAEFFHEHEEYMDQLSELLCGFDLGISSVSIKEVEPISPDGDSEVMYVPMGNHGNGDDVFSLPFFEESSGTQSALVLMSIILPALRYGGIAVIDEMDNDLHPFLLPHILDLFKFEHTNPHDAQLIFTCHTPELFNLLMKHQLYLVQKDGCYSETWRLDEVVGLRADDNLYAKYMSGSLDGVPEL